MELHTLYLVVPCYNEEEVLPETVKRLVSKMNALIATQKVSADSRILFVNDGSKDETWTIIDYFCDNDPLIVGVDLSRNKGHQNALMAGLMTVKDHTDADMVISLDADLQDDIDVIDRFIEEYYAGNDIVYGVRSSRQTDTAFKRITAEGFYKLMKLFGVEIVFNHADYRLMSRRAIEALSNFKEVNLFLRGIVPLIGYKTSTVEYERNERFAGESKYPLKKMLNFAFDGITSFSIKPIRFITALGILILALSTLILIIGGITRLFHGLFSPFYPLGCIVGIMGSLQLIAIGIIGEYVGKNYMETKARPKYFISQINSKNIVHTTAELK